MQSEVTAHLAWRDVGDRGHDAGLDPAVQRVPSRDDDYGSKGARASPSPAYQPDSGVANRHACASRHTDHSVSARHQAAALAIGLPTISAALCAGPTGELATLRHISDLRTPPPGQSRPGSANVGGDNCGVVA